MSAYLVLLSLVALLILLVRGKHSPTILFIGLLSGYYFAGMLDTGKFLQGFTNSSLVTLLVMLIVAMPLEKTFFIRFVSNFFFAKARSQIGVQAKIVIASSLISSFMNNTAVVAAFLRTIKNNTKYPPSIFLIPLVYATTLGGMITLVGTSTNLIVSSLVESRGLPPLKIFDFAFVGIAVSVVGGLVLILFSHRLLKDREKEQEADEQSEPYFLEARVKPGSRLAGSTVIENGLRNLDHLFLVEVIRSKHLISPVPPNEVILENDTLLFSGAIDQIHELARFDGLEVTAEHNELERSNLVEAVVLPFSSVVGKTIRNANFRSLFSAGVVGVRRAGERLSGKLGDVTIEAGDELVLAAGPDFKTRGNIQKNFVLTGSIENSVPYKGWKSYFIFFGFMAAIAISAFEIMELLKSLLLLLAVFVLTGIVTIQDVRRNARYDLFIMIGSTLGLSTVIVDSGAAALLAGWITTITSGTGPMGGMIGVYLLTMILTNIVTNNAAAALAFPFAISTAQGLEVSPMPFIFAVAFGASCAFLTPFGYQTNLMVYSPGRYRAVDYVRVGLPLTLVYSAVSIWLIPIFFPF